MCQSPTMNKPPDLRHKTFSLCRHKTKGHPSCLFKLEKRQASPKISNFARIHFEPHREFTKEQGKISLCLTKNISVCGPVEIFLLGFVSFSCSVEKKYLNLSLKFSNTFLSFRNKHRVLCKQPGHILILIHTMAGT